MFTFRVSSVVCENQTVLKYQKQNKCSHENKEVYLLYVTPSVPQTGAYLAMQAISVTQLKLPCLHAPLWPYSMVSSLHDALASSHLFSAFCMRNIFMKLSNK